MPYHVVDPLSCIDAKGKTDSSPFGALRRLHITCHRLAGSQQWRNLGCGTVSSIYFDLNKESFQGHLRVLSDRAQPCTAGRRVHRYPFARLAKRGSRSEAVLCVLQLTWAPMSWLKKRGQVVGRYILSSVSHSSTVHHILPHVYVYMRWPAHKHDRNADGAGAGRTKRRFQVFRSSSAQSYTQAVGETPKAA